MKKLVAGAGERNGNSGETGWRAAVVERVPWDKTGRYRGHVRM